MKVVVSINDTNNKEIVLGSFVPSRLMLMLQLQGVRNTQSMLL